MTRIQGKAFKLFLSIVFIAISFCGCSQPESETNPSSGNQKFVGSQDTPGLSSNMKIFQNSQEIVEESPLIVMAHYSDEPQVIEEKLSGKTYYASEYHLQVDEVLKGECEDVILFWQSGKPDSDDYETKIKKDRTYILFLAEKPIDSKKPIYDAVGVEQGILEISPSDTLYCYYDAGFMPTYDGKPSDTLIQDIKTYAE